MWFSALICGFFLFLLYDVHSVAFSDGYGSTREAKWRACSWEMVSRRDGSTACLGTVLSASETELWVCTMFERYVTRVGFREQCTADGWGGV
jgi:hypothetical protein